MELLSDLIKIKSWAENSQGLEEVINLVEKYLQKNISGLYLKKFLHKGKPSLVASFYDTKEFDLILNGHLDVVPGSAEIFNLKTEENLLKGRGVYDMKMGGYMMIKVMQELQAQKPNIALMLTTDEEVGGENGVRYLLEQEKYRAKVVFIPDGSSGLDYLGKGIINLKVATKGISAHSAYPWRGENALDKLLKAIQQIKQNLPQANLSEDNYWHTTYSFNKIQSGEALNQVPDYAELGINIRYIPEDNPQEIIKNIQNSCADLAEVETLILAPTLSNSLDNPYIDEYRKIYQSITQNDLVLHKVCGASDARFFSELGMPVILTNFKGGDLHTETEWADYKSMLELKQVLLEYIKKLVS